MEKMKMESPDLVAQNIKKIAELFPNCITEMRGTDGKLKKAINFDALKQTLSSDVLEGPEAYEFTWVGKKAAEVEAYAPIRNTLRPCVEDSVDWDTTENLYIEGDNLKVLKLLQEGYLGKVKLIYIDPPYNTGKDFIYKDNFFMSSEEYAEESGQYDDEGNRLFKNTDVNGRFHSDWCSMMYSRLLLARNLLSDDGAIFISIDDNEVTNLTKICDDVFGAVNRIALICHKSRASISNDKIISPNHNTILFYAKNHIELEKRKKMIGLDSTLEGFDLDDDDGRGAYRLVPVDGPGGARKGNPYFEFLGVEGYWRFSKTTMQEKYDQGLIVRRGNSLYQKYFLSTAKQARKTTTTWWEDENDNDDESMTTWWKEAGLMSTATSRLKELMGEAVFDSPKPLELIDRMLRMLTFDAQEAIVLDFFSGSATTAHAVMQLNAEDGGCRKFIMIQMPEACAENSVAYLAGYKNICEIGKERIRRAGKKIKEENQEAADLDVGFRVFKLDKSNMKDVYYNADEYNQEMLSDMESNIEPDRNELDLLFGCLIDLGIPLSNPYSSEEIDGVNVHTYNYADGKLIACFDENIPDSVIDKIAKKKPNLAVFRDSSFADSPAKINVREKFKMLSRDTKVKVL